MTLIDGKALADKMAVELKAKVETLKAAGVTPGLVVILVGENPASQVYVRNKERRATAAGFNSEVLRLAEDTTEAALLTLIDQLNHDAQWHGILVQLPLPAHISEEKILLAIDPDKDVDGFHPTNMGKLWSGSPVMIPSTPAGIMVMLEAYGIEVAGKQALVLINRHAQTGVRATGTEVIALAQAIQTSVHERFGVHLEMEPVVI